jgi:hypothetical protein
MEIRACFSLILGGNLLQNYEPTSHFDILGGDFLRHDQGGVGL